MFFKYVVQDRFWLMWYKINYIKKIVVTLCAIQAYKLKEKKLKQSRYIHLTIIFFWYINNLNICCKKNKLNKYSKLKRIKLNYIDIFHMLYNYKIYMQNLTLKY